MDQKNYINVTKRFLTRPFNLERSDDILVKPKDFDKLRDLEDYLNYEVVGESATVSTNNLRWLLEKSRHWIESEETYKRNVYYHKNKKSQKE